MGNTTNATRLPTLYEIVQQLRRHQTHIEHLKTETESLFAQEPENPTLHGMIGYLEERKTLLEEARIRIEAMQDYPGSILSQQQEEQAQMSITNAVKDALAANGNGK